MGKRVFDWAWGDEKKSSTSTWLAWPKKKGGRRAGPVIYWEGKGEEKIASP